MDIAALQRRRCRTGRVRPQRRGWGRRRRWGASTLRAAGAIRVGHPKIAWWHQTLPGWCQAPPRVSERRGVPPCGNFAAGVAPSRGGGALYDGAEGVQIGRGPALRGSAPEWGAVRCGRGVRLSMTPPRHASAPCPCSRCGAGAAVVVAGVPDALAAVSGCVGLWRLTGHHRGRFPHRGTAPMASPEARSACRRRMSARSGLTRRWSGRGDLPAVLAPP